jgi:hypothetical protein
VLNLIPDLDVRAAVPSEGTRLLWENLSYGHAGAWVDLPAATPCTLLLDGNNDGAPDASFQTPAFASGTVATLYVVATPTAFYLVVQDADGTLTRIDAL